MQPILDHPRAWLRTESKDTYPCLFNCSLHFYNKQVLIVGVQDGTLSLFYMDDSLQVVNTQTICWSHCHPFDPAMLHKQSFLINGRLYLLKNVLRQQDQHVLIADLSLSIIFPVLSDGTRPQTFRLNYSAVLAEFKIFILGGLDQQLECLSTLESFDVTTYQWEQLTTSGPAPCARHSHSALVLRSKMYIVGGNTSADLFLKEHSLQDVYCLDLDTLSWVQLHSGSGLAVPKYLGYLYCGPLDESSLIVFWCDRPQDDYYLQASRFCLSTNTWHTLPPNSSRPQLKYGAAFGKHPSSQTFFFYGGFSFTQDLGSCVCSDLDRFGVMPKTKGDTHLHKDDKTQAHSVQPNTDKASPASEEQDELTFEELLEQEKRLQKEEEEQSQKKKKKKKKRSKAKK